MQREYLVKNLSEPIRVDLYLLNQNPTITRSTIKKIIMSKAVLVDGESVMTNFRVNNGHKITIDLKRSAEISELGTSTELKAVKMPLDIIYEDANIIVVNKDHGLVVHPVYNHKDDTLMNGLVYYVQEKGEKDIRIRPAHRLDKETSGVILFTKTKDAHEFYSKLFESHELEKTYLAVVKGDFMEKVRAESRSPKGYVEVFSYIGRSSTDEKRYTNVRQDKGQPARTRFYFERYWEADSLRGIYSLVKAIPQTGRTHQIRVHLSSIGYPILGDLIYSDTRYKRMMLHAYSLKLPMMEGGEKVFVAEVKEF